MNKFIKNIIHFSLRHRYFVFFLTFIIGVIGFISYQNTPIETFPDVTNTQVIIISQWPGRSAEEVEKFVTIPLETVLNYESYHECGSSRRHQARSATTLWSNR